LNAHKSKGYNASHNSNNQFYIGLYLLLTKVALNTTGS